MATVAADELVAAYHRPPGMRVLVVSAHYPPNFVSGGTLAPQRLAQGLLQRGHAVSVYAGWLGGRSALDSWTDTDAVGMAVRWVVTTPWLAWDDTRNYENAAVEADFVRHVREVRPDVVHFHSLQSLGAGLLRVAAEAGAKVVVTMHDFWWWCARQFLVTPDFRPCCLVVSCGTCPCEVDRAWLAERDAVLAAALSHADMVLAVSRSAAAVMAANGVDPALLRVDENGVPSSGRRPTPVPRSALCPPPAPSDVVRFIYTGGYHRMKGAHVIFKAARRLAGLPGWQLITYGAESFVRNEGVDLGSLPVEVRPPFDPDRGEAVWAESDVLVVPSVMRETYSLVTREALTRGVPVVCTDSLGPEEVVTHERNGLVVPAADDAALAAALARLVTEAGLLDRLKAGCRQFEPRSLSNQVQGLESLYEELLSSPESPSAGARGSSPPRVVQRVLFLVGIEGAPLRYRARLPAEALELVGVHADVCHYRDPAARRLAPVADAVVVYRVPATTQVLDLVRDVKDRGVPVFFDVDDLIFDPDLAEEIPALAILPPDEATLWMQGVRRYRTTMEACDAFIGSTNQLCRHAEEVVGMASNRFANGVGRVLAQVSDAALNRPRSPGPLRIGYLSGTNTHDHDWLSIESVVAEVLEDRPEVELWLVGLVRPSSRIERLGRRVRRLPLQPWDELPGLLRDLDVNLAPLQPGSRFNDAKSAIKWLEAALTATPTVATPSEPFREAVRHLENGMLAATTDEWAHALRLMIDDEQVRQRLGRRARRDALLQWSPHLQARRYLEILERGPKPRSHQSSWVPVAHDEPWEPVRLEPYRSVTAPGRSASPPGAKAGRWLRQALWLSRRGLRSLRKEGPRVAVRRLLWSWRRRQAGRATPRHKV